MHVCDKKEKKRDKMILELCVVRDKQRQDGDRQKKANPAATSGGSSVLSTNQQQTHHL
jgi:hypothetical protein